MEGVCFANARQACGFPNAHVVDNIIHYRTRLFLFLSFAFQTTSLNLESLEGGPASHTQTDLVRIKFFTTTG